MKSMMQASQSESREQVSALQLTVAGQSAQIASLLSLVKSGTAQTVMKVDAIQIGVGARVQKMEEYLGTMTKQVAGALERTQQLISVYKADDMRGYLGNIEVANAVHKDKVEEELHYLRVQMQAVESYSAYDQSLRSVPGTAVRGDVTPTAL